MTTRRADPIRYLADENAIGLAKVLIMEHSRTDVRHVGQAELPEIPRGTPDLQWLAWAGQRGWIVLTRDRRIRTRPAELRAFREHGVRVVWIGGKRDHSAATWRHCSSSTSSGCSVWPPSWAPGRGSST